MVRLESNPLRRLARRLSVNALGVSLLVLVSVTWGTGLAYLAVRLGLPSPVQLALVEVVHIYVGLAAVLFLAAKVARVGLRRRVSGVPNVLLWQRWLSWALALLYLAVFGSGGLAAAPLPGRWHLYAVNAHLLTSVWALLPTTWHVFAYRDRLLGTLRAVNPLGTLRGVRPTRTLRTSRRRVLLGLGLALGPLAVLVVAPPAFSAITQSGAGASWSQAGLSGVVVNRVLAGPGDRWALAGGDGLFYSSNGRSWRAVGLPSGGSDADRLIDLRIRPEAATPAAPPEAVAGHGAHVSATSVGSVRALALAKEDSSVFVGTADGIYFSPWAEGPYERLPFPSRDVRSIAIDPSNRYLIWATAAEGPYYSLDGGHVWSSYVGGLSVPGSAIAVAFFRGAAYSADATGVFRFDVGGQRWQRVSDERLVTSLVTSEDGGTLYATSHLDGVWSLGSAGGRWAELQLPGHRHGAAGSNSHTWTVLGLKDHLLAVRGSGVLAGDRGGDTWSPIGGNLPGDSGVDAVLLSNQLVVATADGVYDYPYSGIPPATPAWWWAMVVGAATAGVAGVALVGLPITLRRHGQPGSLPMIRRGPNTVLRDDVHRQHN